MAAYPSYTSIPQSGQSRREPVGRRNVIDMAEDNSLRGRNFVASQPFEFSIIHEYRSTDDAATIEAHCVAEGASLFTFVWAFDGADYTCRYMEYPRVEPIDGAGNSVCHITVRLIGTKN